MTRIKKITSEKPAFTSTPSASFSCRAHRTADCNAQRFSGLWQNHIERQKKANGENVSEDGAMKQIYHYGVHRACDTAFLLYVESMLFLLLGRRSACFIAPCFSTFTEIACFYLSMFQHFVSFVTLSIRKSVFVCIFNTVP